jgi:hypothetical protein
MKNISCWLGVICFLGAASTGAHAAGRGSAPIFDCQFDDSSCLPYWTQHHGTWTVATGSLSTAGVPGSISSIGYDAVFTGVLDYTVRMRRIGSPSYTNRVYIRGNPDPLNPDNQEWYSGYSFQFSCLGEYSVWRTQGASSEALQPWTLHTAVHSGEEWNVLRVVADGTSYQYFVNGTLVWSGNSFAAQTGYVGLGMYRPSEGSGDRLDVDWAVLYAEVHPSPATTPTPPPAALDSGDYNGDGDSDIGVFRPSSGLWSVRNLTRVYFGSSADCPASADYNGDGTSEMAVFRPSSGLWSVRDLTRFYFGSSADAAVPGDYSGNGTAAAGIFRPSSGLWTIRGVTRLYFGSSADQAAPGLYWSPWAKKLPAIYRSSSGLWSVRDLTRFYFGGFSDIPVPGNYDGDPCWDGAVYRPSSGLWSVRNVTRLYFGGSADRPVPAKYTGMLTEEIGVHRASQGLWSVRSLTRVYFGSTGDIPVTR